MDDIINKLIDCKRKHAEYFQKYLPDERVKHMDDIISLKGKIDRHEANIISGILSFKYDYTIIYPKLKKHNLESFLEQSDAIDNYLINSSISNSVGHNRLTRIEAIDEFKDLCSTFWEDFIITSEERKSLNQFCKENSIDIVTQQFIESEVIKSINKENFDTEKIVQYYVLHENLDANTIHKILKREYRISVPLDKIKQIIIGLEIGNQKIDNLKAESNILYKLNFGKAEVIIDLVDDNNLPFDFKISYLKGLSGNYKISIPTDTYRQASKSDIIDIISDAICYKNSYQNVTEFLELKPKVKKSIKNMISN